MTLMTLYTTWLGFGPSLSSPGVVPAPLKPLGELPNI